MQTKPRSINFTHSIHSEIFKVASETFVYPDVIPPSAGNQVAEPLVSELVSSDSANVHLVQGIGFTLFV